MERLDYGSAMFDDTVYFQATHELARDPSHEGNEQLVVLRDGIGDFLVSGQNQSLFVLLKLNEIIRDNLLEAGVDEEEIENYAAGYISGVAWVYRMWQLHNSASDSDLDFPCAESIEAFAVSAAESLSDFPDTFSIDLHLMKEDYKLAAALALFRSLEHGTKSYDEHAVSLGACLAFNTIIHVYEAIALNQGVGRQLHQDRNVDGGEDSQD